MFARKSIYALAAGTLLAASMPTFADHDRWDREGADRYKHSRSVEYRYPPKREVVVMERHVERRIVRRPVHVERPVYRAHPAPVYHPPVYEPAPVYLPAWSRTRARTQRARHRRRRDRGGGDRQPDRTWPESRCHDSGGRRDRGRDRKSVLRPAPFDYSRPSGRVFLPERVNLHTLKPVRFNFS